MAWPGGAFETRAPSPQTAVDAIPGPWASRFPPPHEDVQAGESALFDDPKVRWGLERLGGVADRTVVELGPLEGGHSAMAHRGGAARVVSVEANRQAFLKCLVTKELLGLERCSFLCGDVMAYLETTGERFDVCIASGVLYHMAEPVRLLDLISRRASRLYLWTHYYDAAMIAGTPLERRIGARAVAEVAGFRHALHRHRYGVGTRLPGFWGGTKPYSNWITRGDLLGALRHFGWRDVEVAFEEAHAHGPALALVATRAGGDA